MRRTRNSGKPKATVLPASSLRLHASALIALWASFWGSPRAPEAFAAHKTRAPERARTIQPESKGADQCVSGGAPLVGRPVIAADGSVHFLTSDSYLHSFEGDGRFRSSYTLDAGVEFGLGERDDGALFAITARGGLYTWETSGRLRFYRALGSRPLGDALGLGEGRLGVWVAPGHFLAVGAWGQTLYQVPVHGRMTLGPREVGGQAWFARGSQILVLEAAWRQHVFDLNGPIEALESAGGDSPAFALVGGSMYQITHKSGVPQAAQLVGEGVLSLSSTRGALARVRKADRDFELALLGPSGELLAEERVPRPPVGPPAVFGDSAFFPLGGAVLQLSRVGSQSTVFASDPGQAIYARGATLVTVRRGHLVCWQERWLGQVGSSKRRVSGATESSQ